MENINLYNQDCLEGIKTLAENSVDVICTDPPYLYLKRQKLDREFDEKLFFNECLRVLKPGGFIVLFGRGTSFYRWNYLLSEIGFEFKEEIVWNKSHCSSPLMSLSRIHETVSIHSKGKGKINKVKVPYLEMKGHDLDGVIQDVKRLRSILNNTKSLSAVLSYLENNCHEYINTETFSKNNVTADIKSAGDTDRAAKVISSIRIGMNEKSIIEYGSGRKHKNSISVQPSNLINEDRSQAVVRIIDKGMNEKSIIKQVRDHYTAIHPTQKPVRLLERLLALVIQPNYQLLEIHDRPLVVDFFAGSASTGETCHNMGLNFIGYEIDKEYYDKAMERISNLTNIKKAV